MEGVGQGEISVAFATAFEVLEHLFDPSAFLKAVKRSLVPDGVLLLTTLTVTGFDIQVLWEYSKSVYPPHHINLLSVNGTRQLMERNGFEVMEITTPGELDVDIVRNMLRESPELKIPRFVRRIIDAPEDVRSDFQSFLKRNGLSSHMRVIAKRRGKLGDEE
jgi:hypothetical protein